MRCHPDRDTCGLLTVSLTEPGRFAAAYADHRNDRPNPSPSRPGKNLKRTGGSARSLVPFEAAGLAPGSGSTPLGQVLASAAFSSS